MKHVSGVCKFTALLLVAAAVLSSIPARASGPSKSVLANGLGGSVNFVDMSNPDDYVSAFVNLSRTSNTTYFLVYFITDAAGTVNDSSFGSIPASSVNVSGGSINTGKVVVKLNVNTCDFPEFIANGQGCGTFDMTWTELPASFAGSSVERVNNVTTFPPSPQFPEGQKMVQNGDFLAFSALVTGTALNFSPTGGPAFGSLTEEKNVTKTFTTP